MSAPPNTGQIAMDFKFAMDFLVHCNLVLFLHHYLLHKCPLGNFSWRTRFQHTHRMHRHTKTQNIQPHPTTTTCHYHRRRCLFRCCLHVQQPPPRALPPTTMKTMRDDCAEVPDRAAARSRERQGAVFCALPSPALDGEDNDNADWVVAHGLTSSGDGSLMASTLCWSAALLLPWGGEGGGGRRRGLWDTWRG